MTTPASLAMLRFGFHGGGGFSFLLIVLLGVGFLAWLLTRSDRNSA